MVRFVNIYQLLNEVIPDLIKTERFLQKMTLQNLADKSGVSVPTISKIECGKTSANLGTILQLLYALGYSEEKSIKIDTLGYELRKTENL